MFRRRSLDVEYVFVVFGGVLGFPSDDINKFLWMVRIGGGVYPEIKESDYLDSSGNYHVGAGAPPNMLRSLMYRLSYYQFAEKTQLMYGGSPQHRGYDRVRSHVIGKLNIDLKYFEEVFTSENWLMRIYQVRDKPNRAPIKKERNSGIQAATKAL